MPELTVTFDERYLWGTINNNQRVEEWLPMAMVRVHAPGSALAWDGLGHIDTGAQYLVLPADTAKTLGIDLASCSKDTIVVASGEEFEVVRTMVDVTIKGRRANVLAYFGVVQAPLIGVETIYKVMTFGLDEDGWLRKEPGTANQPWFVRVLKVLWKAIR